MSLPNEAELVKKRNHLNEMIPYFQLSSLLSDSNQRPRDYKSRALAN